MWRPGTLAANPVIYWPTYAYFEAPSGKQQSSALSSPPLSLSFLSFSSPRFAPRLRVQQNAGIARSFPLATNPITPFPK
jgi:hypothetical protein